MGKGTRKNYRFSEMTINQLTALTSRSNVSETALLENLIAQEYARMNARHEFPTKQDAYAAGYRPVNRKTDKDISGDGYYGYDFSNAAGEKT